MSDTGHRPSLPPEAGPQLAFNRAAFILAGDILLDLFREDFSPSFREKFLLSNNIPADDCDTPFAVASASQAVWTALSDFVPSQYPIEWIDPDAALLSMRQERYLEVDGAKPTIWDEFSSLYECANGDLVQLHCNFPNHRDAALKALDFPRDVNEAKARARVMFHTGDELEEKVLELGGAAAKVRDLKPLSQKELEELSPLVEIQFVPHGELNDSSNIEGPSGGVSHLKEPVASATTSKAADGNTNNVPLQRGLRVVDMTRVLAGPVATRAMKEVTRNAQILTVTDPDLPQVEFARLLFSLGKRSAFCNLKDPKQLRAFHELLGDADVFVQSFRPNSLDRFDLGDEMLMQKNKNLVKVNIRAFEGSNRRGYDSLLQCYTGMFSVHSSYTGRREHLPVQALDHLTGLLACLGALVAIRRRQSSKATINGSFVVNVSLERTARFLIDQLPRRSLNGLQAKEAAWMRSGLKRIEARSLSRLLVTKRTVQEPAKDPSTVTITKELRFLKGVLGDDDVILNQEDFAARPGLDALKWL